MGSWSMTPALVLSRIGESVTATHIAQAGEVIELHLNMTEAASGVLRARDLSAIQSAVMWQAPWMRDNPGLVSRHAVRYSGQDGVSVGFDGDSSLMLSPFARRALKNVSWKGWRTIRTLPSNYLLGQEPVPRTFDNENGDDLNRWEYL